MRFLLLGAVLSLILLPGLAHASPGQGGDLDRLSGSSTGSDVTDLPSWSTKPAAQAPETGAENVAPPPNPGGAPTQVPVDGGLGLLALAGAGYAAKKLRRR